MNGIRGSERLQKFGNSIARALREHNQEVHPPDAQKQLRSFSMREAAQFLGLKDNTFRHYLKVYEGKVSPGTLVQGNRRVFKSEEVEEIRHFLNKSGKFSPDIFPRRQPGEKLQVITTFNLKGGVSKTSVATNIATLLSTRGYRVLLGDVDAQSSSTHLFGFHPEADPEMKTVYDVIKHDNPVSITEAIRPTCFPNLKLLPCSLDIVEFEYETALSFRNPTGSIPFHTRLARAFAEIEDQFDLIVIDTPPQLTFAVIACLFAANGLVIPLGASMLDVMSLTAFLSMAGDLMRVVESQDMHKHYDFIRFLITRFEESDQPQMQMASFLRTILGDAVLGTSFIKSTAIVDAANTTQTVLEVEPREFNRRTYERIMECIWDMTDEIERDMYAAWGRPLKKVT